MRESKVKYDPSLSVRDNALKSGVSEATIRYYIKTHNLDRRFDRKQNIIADCRKYLKKNPNATREQIKEKTGFSLCTIRKYWEYISTETELIDFDNEKAKKRQQIEEEKQSRQIALLGKIPVSVIEQYLADYKKQQKAIEKARAKAQAKESKIAQLKEQIDKYLEQEHENTKALNATPSFYPIPTKADLFNSEWNQYDSSKYVCVAFRSSDDKWKDLWVPFGNMVSEFKVRIADIEPCSSEHAYMLGVFSNSTSKHLQIQKQLLKEPRGYIAKKNVRMKNRIWQRLDWHDFKIDWMLYCVWQKVQQNEEFRNLLLAVPQGATIIEDNSFKKGKIDKYWGTFNPVRREFGSLANRYAKTLNLKTKKATQAAADALVWDFCNYGVFEGTNEMGRILTYLKDCLHKGTEPEIDYDLLKRKKIYILGELMKFDK